MHRIEYIGSEKESGQETFSFSAIDVESKEKVADIWIRNDDLGFSEVGVKMMEDDNPENRMHFLWKHMSAIAWQYLIAIGRV